MKKTTIHNKKFDDLFGGEFELIESGYSDGAYNMDFDAQRTKKFSESKALPMFRIYGWEPWCVSLGYNQKREEIDEEKAAEAGFDIVRRPTGGRAVLHAEELTYSVVTRLTSDKTAQDAYRAIHMILLEAINRLGTNNVDFEKSQMNFGKFYKEKKDLSVSCFASSARYEIACDSKKIVGSAQRRFGDVLLQHGSILLDKGHERLADVAKVKDESKRGVLKDYIMSHSVDLSEVSGRKINYEDLSAEIISVLTE